MPGLRLWIAALTVTACAHRAPPADLSHDAYVWQRAWTGPVRDAVATTPEAIGGLRVLAAEVAPGQAMVVPAVDSAALARAARPVIAVVRVDGSRPMADLSLAPVLTAIDRWRAAGVAVTGIEIDHDCATAALPDYAAWLVARRPSGLAWSITALPTWAESRALPAVAAAVDELVVQVHAVRAPVLFDPTTARRDLVQFAAAVPRARLRVALPTYDAVVQGHRLRTEPDEVAGFLRGLERRPIAGVVGVVWFRLPVDGDRMAWSRATLAAVIAGRPLAPDIAVRAEPRGGAVDIVVVNDGTRPGPWPDLRVADAVAADLIGGYLGAGPDWIAPRRTLDPGERVVVGWATGPEVKLHVR